MADEQLQLLDPVTQKPTKKLEFVGPLVKEIFPLLDPDLSEMVAKQAHKKLSEATNMFMTQTREAILQYCMQFSENRKVIIASLVEQLPMIMPFVPNP